MLLSISEASDKLGITIGTLREWEKEGLITPVRTPGKHRRYNEEDLCKVMGTELKSETGKKTILYCRCSTEKQRENMKRQKLRLMEYAHDKKYDYEVMEEIASGVNENRRQLNKLMDKIIAGQVCRVVIEWKDGWLGSGTHILRNFVMPSRLRSRSLIIGMNRSMRKKLQRTS